MAIVGIRLKSFTSFVLSAILQCTNNCLALCISSIPDLAQEASAMIFIVLYTENQHETWLPKKCLNAIILVCVSTRISNSVTLEFRATIPR